MFGRDLKTKSWGPGDGGRGTKSETKKRLLQKVCQSQVWSCIGIFSHTSVNLCKTIFSSSQVKTKKSSSTSGPTTTQLPSQIILFRKRLKVAQVVVRALNQTKELGFISRWKLFLILQFSKHYWSVWLWSNAMHPRKRNDFTSFMTLRNPRVIARFYQSAKLRR